jgi:prepilin-type N-terminal cleavage/methylation domain-containing protein
MTMKGTTTGAGARRAGFTLMEVLVAMVVLGTGIVLLSQGLTAAIRSSAQAERTTRACGVADEILQRMETGEIDFLSETDGTLDAFEAEGATLDEEGEESYRQAYRWISDVTPWTVDDLYQVTLRVTWTDTGFETEKYFEAVRLFYRPPEDEAEDTSSAAGGGSGAGTGSQ